MACASLAACAVGPDYRPPEMVMPATFVATSAKAANLASGRRDRRAVDPSQWWRALRDRELESLIDRAVAASPTLEVALNRLQEARAQEAVVVGSALPMLEGSEGGALGTGSDLARGRASPPLVSAENGTGFAQVSNLVGFDAGWELDLFGKFRREIEAARYDVEAAAAARNIVLVSLIADVTRAYLDMRALQVQLAVLRKSIDVAQHYVDFVQERFNRGITNELDVTLAQRELGQLQSQVAPLIARIDAARYVIAVLVGTAEVGRAADASGAHPARAADRAAAPPARRCRGRTPIGQRHRADWRCHRRFVSPGGGDRSVWIRAGAEADAGGHQSDLVDRAGCRRAVARFWPARCGGGEGRFS
jgi:outer membrane protein TolC